LYFMNWRGREKGSSYSNSDPKGIPGKKMMYKRSFALLGIDDNTVRWTLGKPREAEYLTARFLAVADTFFDNDGAFARFLEKEGCKETAKRLGLSIRSSNQVHTKRIGIPLNKQTKSLPEVSRDEHYFTFLLGNNEHTVRFIEVECP